MNKKLLGIIGLILVILGILYHHLEDLTVEKPVTIGILVPIEHKALQEIVGGFKQVISEHYAKSVVFNVQNAHGDLKLQRSIIDLFMGQKMDLIVPIGSNATQMTLTLVKQQPIVSLAAMYSEVNRQKRQPQNITGILDEIGGKKKLDFIKVVLPDVQKITLIFHSGNEKNFQEVEEISKYCKALGLILQTIMVQNLPELETAAQNAAPDTNAILVLKDHLIASGIRMLVSIAKSRKIPLITSDEGTIYEGGTFALGVRERMIGEEGGALAIKVLEGFPIANLPMQAVKELAVFYNPKALAHQKVELKSLQRFATQHHYPLVAISD